MASPLAQEVLPEDLDHLIHSENESSTSNSGSDGDGDSDEEPVEWLVQGREKRATAGNRLSTLVQQAAAEDDELNLLFEEPEDGEDEGFQSGDEDASDVQMDSSDDDEDQGPTVAAEELDGERELQRAERQSKKRKVNDGIPKAFRKKVKTDPTAPLAPPPRPKKKSERASWIPNVAEGPTRASSRKTTKESKEQLHVQMIDREKKRLKQLKSMEKAAATREANKAKELTQEDRLKEAARIEKHNAKSLNKWEEAEKAREEERRQKLEDLHNRTLSGPVITWWSGVAEWVDGKIKRVGKALVEERPKPAAGIYMTKKRKQEAAEAEAAAAAAGSAEPSLKVIPSAPSPGQETAAIAPVTATVALASGEPPYSSTAAHSTPSMLLTEDSSVNPQGPSPNISSPEMINGTAPNPILSTPSVQQANLQPPKPLSPVPVVASLVDPVSLNPPSDTPPANTITAESPTIPTLPRMMPSPSVPFTLTSAPPQPLQPLHHTNIPAVIEHSTRNCIILENFDETSVKDKAIQTQILFGQKTVRIPKVYKTPKTLASKDATCVITGYTARYRDPGTGLPYFNGYAYKEIQKLKRGDYRWSSLLQAYVGQSTYVARGVPARFVEPKPGVK